MQPKTLLAAIAFTIVMIVLILYLTAEDESLLELENTGPPEVSLHGASADSVAALGLAPDPAATHRVPA